MKTLEELQAINLELDSNLDNMPSEVAFLIHDLRCFHNYKSSKRKAILDRAIITLYKGLQK